MLSDPNKRSVARKPNEQAERVVARLLARDAAYAAKVARVFAGLRNRGIERDHAQRFVLQSVMAMFAEDIRLLPGPFFALALDDSTSRRTSRDTAMPSRSTGALRLQACAATHARVTGTLGGR